MVVVADNTGAKKLQVIRVLGGYQKRHAGIGDVVTAVVKMAVPHGTVQKSQVVHAVIVPHPQGEAPQGRSYVRFDDKRRSHH